MYITHRMWRLKDGTVRFCRSRRHPDRRRPPLPQSIQGDVDEGSLVLHETKFSFPCLEQSIDERRIDRRIAATREKPVAATINSMLPAAIRRVPYYENGSYPLGHLGSMWTAPATAHPTDLCPARATKGIGAPKRTHPHPNIWCTYAGCGTKRTLN